MTKLKVAVLVFAVLGTAVFANCIGKAQRFIWGNGTSVSQTTTTQATSGGKQVIWGE